MNLKNKVAVVAGGARDIGRAISVKLAQEGARVVVNFHSSEEQARETLAAIEQVGGEAIAVKGDMTSSDDVNNLLAKTQEAYGESVDVLVNVVGGLVARKSLAEMDQDFLEYVMRLNVSSTFLLTQAFAPTMGEGTAIVNIASQAGRDGGGPGAAAYSSAKAAVMTFTRAMAKELGPQGIRVNSLCPGMISTTFHDTFTKDQVRANVAAATPLRREGRAEEIAEAVAFLATGTGFIHGANIDINGGSFFS